jgi:hypothetical protein
MAAIVIPEHGILQTTQATVMVMHYSWGDDDCTFVNFNSNHLNFTQPMGYNSLSFTELIPAQ